MNTFEEFKAYKIKRSLAITESTVELMDVMSRMIKKLDKCSIPYNLNLDKDNDDYVQIGYHWGSFKIDINNYSLIININKEYDYSPWKYEILDREVRYFGVLTTIFENKKKLINDFIETIEEDLLKKC